MNFLQEKIASVKVHLVSQKVSGNFTDATRSVETIGFLIVRITTESGVEGFGMTYHEVGGEAIKVLIEKNIAPKLIGADPFETEMIWNQMFGYLRGVGRKGLMYCALSAIDIALWDIKGKALNVPLYKLWGGGKTELPVYASGGWTSYSDDELVEEIGQMVAAGYTMVKFKVGVEEGRNLKRDLVRVGKVRDAIGPDIGIMLDANNCWDSATGARFANMVKDLDIMFLEEPVFADDIHGLRKYKLATDLPLATGEHEYTRYGCRDLLMNDAADIVQLDGTRAGGFSEMLKVMALTEAWNVKFAPHAMEYLHMHLLATATNGLFLEKLLLFEEITYSVFKNVPKPVNGMITVPQLPGMGLELDMDFIKDREE